LGKNEAARHNWWHKLGTRTRHRTVSGQFEDKIAVFSQLLGALLRAGLVLLVIAMPSAMLPSATTDTNAIVALLAIIAAVFTFVEYYSNYPSLVEFRDAPPFNRVRYISLILTVFLLCTLFQGQFAPSILTEFIGAVGMVIGQALDFPYSPVNLVIKMLPENASQQNIALIQAAAGISYLVFLLTLAIFLIAFRLQGWPSSDKPFNIWVNLPTFDPSSGGDIIARLKRDGQLNIILGFTLPFLLPAVIGASSKLFNPIVLDSPQTMVWVMTVWAFFPASLFMRGIAMRRIAFMVQQQQKTTAALDDRKGFSLA
jgi:hypothetical protein